MKAYATRKEQGSSLREPRGFFHRQSSDETLIVDIRGASRPAQLVELRLSRLLSNAPVRLSHMQVVKLSRDRFRRDVSDDSGDSNVSSVRALVTRTKVTVE